MKSEKEWPPAPAKKSLTSASPLDRFATDPTLSDPLTALFAVFSSPCLTRPLTPSNRALQYDTDNDDQRRKRR